MANVLSVANLPVNTVLNLLDTNQGSVQCLVVAESGGGGGTLTPLSNVRFVDQDSASPGPEDGSIGNPWKTATAAYADLLGFEGEAIQLTPYDYTGEAAINLASNVTWIGWGDANNPQDSSTDLVRLPDFNATLIGAKIGFFNVKTAVFNDTVGECNVQLTNCQVSATMNSFAEDGGSIRFTNCTFTASVDLANWALITFDVPSYLSWLNFGGTFSGSSSAPVIEGEPFATMPFYISGAIATGAFLQAYGIAGAAEEQQQIPCGQASRLCRLRMKSTVPLGAANVQATVRINGLDTALVLLMTAGTSTAESTTSLIVPEGAFVSIQVLTAGATVTNAALWAMLDLYP
jgi:hypothetical protein